MLHGLARGSELPSGSRSLPWLEALEDVRLGRTRLGESARRSTENNTPLMVRLGPAANPTRDTQWTDSPRDVAQRFHAVMATWIRHLCETRGVLFVPVRSVRNDHVGAIPDGWRRLPRDYRASSIDCAEWLAHHIQAIAADEAAAELYNDVKRVVDDIERIVNRPIPDQFCGTCTGQHEGAPCDVRLYAPKDATEVICVRCDTKHQVAQLFQQTLDKSDDKSFTISELHRTILPAVREYVPPRTLQHWAACGRLVPTGYGADGEPRYLLAEVRRLRDAKTQNTPTGAAAAKYKRRAS